MGHISLSKNKFLYNKFIKKVYKQRYLFFLALPAVLIVFVFHYIPIYGILIAFKDYKVSLGIWNSEWVGLKYFTMFLKNPLALRLFKNTFSIGFFTLLFTFPAPILLALFINEIRHKLYKRFVQSISYIPHFISAVVVVGFLTTFSASDGMFNQIRSSFGLEPKLLMADPRYFVSLYVASAVWSTVGWGSIIYLAALSGIDPTLYDVASLDGANRYHKMRYISWPAIKPTTTILLILSLRNILQSDFMKILLMQNDSNRSASDIISTYVYREGIQGARFEYATAVNLFLSIIAFVIVYGANLLSKKISETSLW